MAFRATFYQMGLELFISENLSTVRAFEFLIFNVTHQMSVELVIHALLNVGVSATRACALL